MDIARHWRLKKHRYALQTENQAEAVLAVVGPSSNGHKPYPEEQIAQQETITGEVYSFATVFEAPEGYQEFAPYPVAMVKLDDGSLITAQLTDVDLSEIEIGMPVEMVTRKLRSTVEDRGMLVYGYKFRPLLAQ